MRLKWLFLVDSFSLYSFLPFPNSLRTLHLGCSSQHTKLPSHLLQIFFPKQQYPRREFKFLEDIGTMNRTKKCVWTRLEENLKSKSSMIGITFVQKKSKEGPPSSGVTTMDLSSLYFRNSIQNTNGIHFDSLKFLKATGTMKTIRETA